MTQLSFLLVIFQIGFQVFAWSGVKPQSAYASHIAGWQAHTTVPSLFVE
jgi:hypothetical protein